MTWHQHETATRRWERVQDLFHVAVNMEKAESDLFLARECADDESISAQVRRMLDADQRADSLLDGGLGAAAARLLDEPTPAPPPAGAFGPYRLKHAIGEGGMAIVYLAEREDLGSLAAIKLLHHAWLSPARRARFAVEQRTLARLHHPGIAHLYDAGALDDGTPWIAMEYVDGQPLGAWCRANRASLATRLRLFREVCEAVQHAHGHLIVHRDLKPSNILVAADGRVKLLDFGIAKQLEPTGDDAQATRTGLRLLTPAYAAPEQLLGRPIGVHTDVYALGVILYELLTGALPFDPASRNAALANAPDLEQTPERPSSVIRRHTGPVDATGAEWADLDVLCLTAMHADPQRRYPTVDALLRDVEHFTRREPLRARPDSVAYRLGTFARRRRMPLAAGALALTALVAISTVYALRIQDARDAALVEAERAQRMQQFTLRLFEGGEEAGDAVDSLRVETLVERGVAEAAGLSDAPLVQGEMYQTLGGIFQRLGRLDRADSLLARALASRRGVSAEHVDVARSLVALGLLRIEQARLDDADSLVRAGLAMSERLRAPGHHEIAIATSALGRVLEERGAYDDAIAVMRRALAMHEAIAPVSADVVQAATQLGNDYFYAGDYDQAEQLFQRSHDVAAAVFGTQHPLVADALINLGAVHYQRGAYADAERRDREGLAIVSRAYGADDPRTASAMTMLGRALVAQSRFDEAVPLVEQALAIRERVFGPVSSRVASSVNELGIMALQQERYDQADAYFARNAEIYRAVYNGPHNLLGTALANRGSVFSARGDNRGAERLYRDALEVFSAVLPPTHLDIGITRVKLGRALLRQGDYATAVEQSATGLDILLPQLGGGSGFVKNARRDLAAAYDSLGRGADADAMRAALADSLAP